MHWHQRKSLNVTPSWPTEQSKEEKPSLHCVWKCFLKRAFYKNCHFSIFRKFAKFSFSTRMFLSNCKLLQNQHYKILISHISQWYVPKCEFEKVGLSNTVIRNKQSFVVVDRTAQLSAFPIFPIPNWKEKWDLSMVKRGIFGNFQAFRTWQGAEPKGQLQSRPKLSTRTHMMVVVVLPPEKRS